MDLFQGWMIATGEIRTAEAQVDPKALYEVMRCPMFRVSRLHDAICAGNPEASGCTIGGWGSDFPTRARRLMQQETTCEWERTAPLEELVFTPVPVEDFLKETNPRNRRSCLASSLPSRPLLPVARVLAAAAR